MSVTASNNSAVDRMEYYLGDKLVFTDYSAPYEVSIDTANLTDGMYTFTAKAYDPYGKITTASKAVKVANNYLVKPKVTILQPLEGATVSGIIIVTANLSDDKGLMWADLKVDSWGVFASVDLKDKMPLTPGPQTETVTFKLNADDLIGYGTTYPTGHTLTVTAFDSQWNEGSAKVDVAVLPPPPPPPPPKLALVSHSVERKGNYFIVSWGIKNVGTTEATNVVLRDRLLSFQPVGRDSPTAECAPELQPWLWSSDAVIKSHVNIMPGELKWYAYEAVPVLGQNSSNAIVMGNEQTLTWESPAKPGVVYDGWYQMAADQTITGEDMLNAWYNAVKTSDYLIVTSTYNLLKTNSSGDVNNLLSSMAELAWLKNGVLAYLDGPTSTWALSLRLKAEVQMGGFLGLSPVVTPVGQWSKLLKSDWCENGYLLLVGEADIVPAWTSPTFGTYPILSASGTVKDEPLYADTTDYPYASTYGDELVPELSIGRIIGNDAKALRIPIQTSVELAKGSAGYQFDRSNGLSASGYPAGLDNDAATIDFKTEASNVAQTMKNKGINTTTLNAPDYTVYDAQGKQDDAATKTAIQNQFFSLTQNTDLVFLAGHGNNGDWGVFWSGDVLAQGKPFGSNVPFVYAASCFTGNYVAGTSLAEAFLQKGAGAYVGATKWGMASHAWISNFFFKEYLGSNEPVGLAMKHVNQYLGSATVTIQPVFGPSYTVPAVPFWAHYWTGIYHVFGDPKFGAVGPPSTPSAGWLVGASAAAVAVPDFQINQINGQSSVTIPGGAILSVAGAPQVPCYRVFYAYPHGTQIQDVVLTSRSAPQAANGLNIPKFMDAQISADSGGIVQINGLQSPAFWPNQPFSWSVFETPDNTVLALTVFPFDYNPLTTDARFYKNYNFNINYTASPVDLAVVATNKHVYQVGEPVAVNIEISSNATEGKDIVVEAAITKENLGEVAGGLPLRTLKNLRGSAAYSSVWDSGGFDPGYYRVDAELRDTQGNLLARQTEGFSLATSLSVPVAVSDNYSVDEGSHINIVAPGVLTNDGDADGDVLTALQVTGPANGKLTLNSDGSFSYTPNPGFFGTDSFAYKTNNGAQDSNVASVTISVNDAPAVGKGTLPTQSVQYSDNITPGTIVATDTDSPASRLFLKGVPAGVSVTKSSNGNGTASSPTSCNWTISGAVQDQAGIYPISVCDGQMEVPSGVAITVTKENAFIQYTGDNLGLINVSLALQATVWDSAAVGYPGSGNETGPGATIGDVAKMWIAFDIYSGTAAGSSPTATVYGHVLDTGTPGDGIGTASANWTSANEGTYSVIARLVASSTGGVNQWYVADEAEPSTISFYQSIGQFATGGGWISDPAGGRGNFGFNARYNNKGSPKGQMVYAFRGLYNGVPADFVIKSNALDALSFKIPQTGTYPVSASLSGHCNIQINRASDGFLLFSDGNWTFAAQVTDGGKSSGVGSDSFSLSVTGKNGNLYKVVPTSVLQGGKVVIHVK